MGRDLAGFYIAVSPMPRTSGSKNTKLDMQAVISERETWLLYVPSMSSQLCYSSKTGFVPLDALVIGKQLLMTCIFQWRRCSLQLHSRKVSLLTEKRNIYFSFSPQKLAIQSQHPADSKLKPVSFGLAENCNGHRCPLRIVTFSDGYVLPGEIIYKVNLKIRRLGSRMGRSLYALSVMADLVSLPCCCRPSPALPNCWSDFRRCVSIKFQNIQEPYQRTNLMSKESLEFLCFY